VSCEKVKKLVFAQGFGFAKDFFNFRDEHCYKIITAKVSPQCQSENFARFAKVYCKLVTTQKKTHPFFHPAIN
jgi:hypothetical protein